MSAWTIVKAYLIIQVGGMVLAILAGVLMGVTR